MRKGVTRLIVATGLVIGAGVASVSGQPAVDSNISTHGMDLGASIGVAAATSDTAPVLAATGDWSLSRWIRVEARGARFSRGINATGVSADVGAQINAIAGEQSTPYFGAAFGLYRATIESSAAGLPDFYRSRVAEQRGSGPWVFTDPAWRLSTGVEIKAHRNISIRPEASVMLVRGHGMTDTLALVEVRVGYAFDAGPAAPSTAR